VLEILCNRFRDEIFLATAHSEYERNRRINKAESLDDLAQCEPVAIGGDNHRRDRFACRRKPDFSERFVQTLTLAHGRKVLS
jgi:hypothetical protein